MAIIFIDDKIRGQLANSIRFTRDLYIKPSNILLEHPNGIDYIVLKNRHFYNHDKQIRPSEISEYTKLNVNNVQYAFLQLGFFKAAKVLSLNGMNLLIDEDFLNPNGKKILKEMVEVGKIKVGDKVVPIKKSIYADLDSSIEWKKAKKSGQGFLYVKNVMPFEHPFLGSIIEISCVYDVNSNVGYEYFLPEDLIPYVEEEEELSSTLRKYVQLNVSQVFELVDAGILTKEDILLIAKL